MSDEVKDLQQTMNDYLVETKAEDKIVFDSLGVFCNFAYMLRDTLSECFEDKQEEIDCEKISKISFTDKLRIINDFYNRLSIKFDLNRHINDGTIDFEYYDYLNDDTYPEQIKIAHLFHGASYYEYGKKLVDICNNGLITDTSIIIHELSHLRNQPNGVRNQNSELLTEALSTTEELIFSDYLSYLGYEEEAKIIRNHIYSYFYCVARDTAPVYKMFLLFKKLGDISKSNYEYLYGDMGDYYSVIDYLSQFSEDGDFDIYRKSGYVLSAILATHMYYNYKEDNSFIKNIIELHDKINNCDVTKCFEIMGLSDLGEEDMMILYDSLNAMKDELSKQECKKG